MSNSDLVVCPPDRLLLVDYLHLKDVLAGELAQLGDEATRGQVQQLLLLLELVTHVEYMQVSRRVKSAMVHTKPMISQDEAASMRGCCPSSTQQQEQVLLDTLIGLLLEGRYFPLSAQEWAVAQRHEFTFDIPVQIDWTVLDDKLLAGFWQRQEAAAATASGSSNGDRPSSALCSSDSSGRAGSSSPMPSGVLLERSQLPDFFDRMLLFHRGVGVATAEGLYLDKKLDLLLAYLVVTPISTALAHARAAVTRLLAAVRLAAAATDGTPAAAAAAPREAAKAAGKLSKISTASWRNVSVLAGHDSDDAELRPFASHDLSHQYARLVVRRSLRSQMPGAREVLAKLFSRLTLLEPTFRDVVVVYRANTQEVAAEAAASAAQAAESAMTAAVYAASGSATMAVDSIVEAARAAAEAKSTSSTDGGTTQQQQQQAVPVGKQQLQGRRLEQQQLPVQDGLDASRRVGLNPSNVIIKSFSDVALADLELVFPSKKAEVLPTTLVRSAITALGAVGAAIAWAQQMHDMQWSLPVVVSAAAVVAGRAVRVLSTVKSNQAALASVMMKMQYDAARDSQEGVVVKLIDELREQHLKEAATAYMVLLTQDTAIRAWQQYSGRRHARNRAAGAGAAPSGAAAAATVDSGAVAGSSSTAALTAAGAGPEPVVFGTAQIDAACEDFLLQRFGLKVDFMIDETLPRMVAWGLLQQQGPQQYSLVPPIQALNNLQAYWQRMQQPAADLHAGAAAAGAPGHAHALPSNSNSSSCGSLHGADAAPDFQQRSAAGAAAAAAAAAAKRPGSLHTTADFAAGRMLGFASGRGGSIGAGSWCARRTMPGQRRCVAPCRLAGGARAARAAAATAASVHARLRPGAAGSMCCWP